MMTAGSHSQLKYSTQW